MVNTELLNTVIRDSGMRKDYLASALHISKQSLSNKINNKTEFKGAECSSIKEMLHLSDYQFVKIFFASKCDCKSQEVPA